MSTPRRDCPRSIGMPTMVTVLFLRVGAAAAPAASGSLERASREARPRAGALEAEPRARVRRSRWPLSMGSSLQSRRARMLGYQRLAGAVDRTHAGPGRPARPVRPPRAARGRTLHHGKSRSHPQLLHHRAHRSRQVDAGGSLDPALRRCLRARVPRSDPRLDGHRARARHHHQEQHHHAALRGQGRQGVPARPDRHAGPRRLLARGPALADVVRRARCS
jgi:hypothetical protein